MKLQTTLLLFFSLSVPAFAQPANLDAIEAAYNDLSSAEDEHTWLNFSQDEGQIRAQLLESRVCSKKGAFTKVTARQWTNLLASELSDAYERIADRDDGYFSFMEKLTVDLKTLRANLRGSTIQICTDLTIPAYSDCHSATFVKVNGKLTVLHEVGCPD